MSILIKGASSLKEGLYQIQDGKIHAYKGNGGKTEGYDLIEVPTPHGRLIEADRLKWQVEGRLWKARDKFVELIDNAPTIEAEPVKRGEWIDDGFYADYYGHHEYRCSECGECYIDYEIEWHYCPNCGAKMNLECKDESD